MYKRYLGKWRRDDRHLAKSNEGSRTIHRVRGGSKADDDEILRRAEQ
jgi:hypothetical protein